MSKLASFSRHARRRLDAAISAAYTHLRDDRSATAALSQLLLTTRRRSSLLSHPVERERRCVQVEALKNLSCFASRYIRTIESWPGTRASAHFGIVASLAEHLLSHYHLPRFLSSVWTATNGRHDDAKRNWFVEHGAGTRFRDLSLPTPITRQMEHIFLHAPDHLTVEQALRRAEIVALGGSEQLVRAVTATSAGNTLEHGEFWRSCMALLVKFQSDLDLDMVAPIVDFIEAIRHRTIEIHTDAGPFVQLPPEPTFSLKGRTLASLLRLVDSWHRRLGRDAAPSLAWQRSRYSGFTFAERPAEPDEEPSFWQLVELTDSAQLQREGIALRHCVASYAYACSMGRSRIWSLQRVAGDQVRRVLTVEIDLRTATIVQARGLKNRPAAGRPLTYVQQWAASQGLRMSL